MAQKYWESGINRRRFLRYTGYGSAVLAVGAAAACGGSSSKSSSSPTAAKPASATSAAASAAAPAAAVKSPTVTQAALNMAIGSEPETLDGDKFRAGTDWYFG